MSARSGLAGKKHRGPHLGSSQAFFSMDRTNQKNAYLLPIFLGGAMGPIHPVWDLTSLVHDHLLRQHTTCSWSSLSEVSGFILSHGRAAKERYCTVPVYLRRGSISAESQHPAHKKNQFWAGKYQKIRWESFVFFLCFLNGRMHYSK